MEPLAPGQTVAARFRLVRRLGEGGSGEVWLAEDGAGGSRKALKFARDAASVERLRAQAAAGRRLVHPGIVPAEDFLDGTGRPCLVMPAVEGGDAGVLRGAGVRAIVAAMIPVAEALEYAHRCGIVHGDLKPANLLRHTDGRLQLTDFMAGRAAGAGTPPSMSPRQIDGFPPVPADDVYGFGALLYELLAGQPLFHPGVTPERIRTEPVAIPAADRAGEPLPGPLRDLLGRMLEKSPQGRPPSMAAVRAALEGLLPDVQVQAASELIRAQARAAEALPAGTVSGTGRNVRGVPAPVVYAALGVLLVIAVGVIVYLPQFVGPAPTSVAVAPSAVPAPAATATGPAPVPDAQQQEFDAALGTWLEREEALRGRGAPQWGSSEWEAIRDDAKAGDDAYRRRDLDAAIGSYRRAAAGADALLASLPQRIESALANGRAALERGDAPAAVAAFGAALVIEADHPEARRGLVRAGKLPRLLSLLGEASAAEAAGDARRALGLYRQAATLDAQSVPARDAVARLERAAAGDAFAREMARGLAAQARGDSAQASAAFRAALQARPGDPQARAALAQAESDAVAARLAADMARARELEAGERWEEALAAYDGLLAADSGLDAAQSGRSRAQARRDLDKRLQAAIADAERFNDDAVLVHARSVLAEANSIAGPGPRLRGQAGELDRLVQQAVVAVTVMFESDNATQVTLYKVGRLGAFDTRELPLRPGRYTVVGTRPGYRDVRRNFLVRAGEANAPVVVRCEEPI